MISDAAADRARVLEEVAPLLRRLVERHNAKSAGEGDRSAHGSPSPRSAGGEAA